MNCELEPSSTVTVRPDRGSVYGYGNNIGWSSTDGQVLAPCAPRHTATIMPFTAAWEMHASGRRLHNSDILKQAWWHLSPSPPALDDTTNFNRTSWDRVGSCNNRSARGNVYHEGVHELMGSPHHRTVGGFSHHRHARYGIWSGCAHRRPDVMHSGNSVADNGSISRGIGR